MKQSIVRFASHPSAAAYVIVRSDDNGVMDSATLVSYSTAVCAIERDENGDMWFYCNGTYSATTRKHIGWFMNTYTPFTYYLAKAIAGYNVRVNMATGEAVEF